MGKIRDLARRLREFDLDRMERQVLYTVVDHYSQLIDYNTQQLLEGKEATGEPVTPVYRSAKYADFKLTLNPRGVVDLKLTGAFHDSFFARVDRFPIGFYARDPKTPDLVAKYGDEIFGLNGENLEEFARLEIKPDLQDFLRTLIRV